MAKFLSKCVHGSDVEAAVAELRAAYDGFPVRQLVFFASYVYDGDRMAALVHDAFPGALTMGCTSYSEFGAKTICKSGIAALAFGPDALDLMEVVVAENVTADPLAADKALATFEDRLGRRMIDLEFREYFGLAIMDGRSPNCEKITERIGTRTDAIFIGGYASDDFSQEKIRLFFNGKTYTDAVLLAVVKPRGKFALIKSQSQESLGVEVVANKVTEADRIVHEFNGRPALEVFTESIGKRPEEFRLEDFMEYMVGVMVDGEPFVRGGSRVYPDGSVQFFTTIKEGQRLTVMRAGDIVGRSRERLEALRRELGGISALLDFDCVHRDMIMHSKKQIDDYLALFEGVEAAGFATFGEVFITDVNQTSVMALFA